ncbi:peptidoglycan D,D-transpeptidase FtsI family protein [Ruania zhangjianzhongii]|uniref:peptidoglycan D,D-transpeptidase FtsI family protein n=1 Tax=Ruania zhangjianzhongii TaxID=2603206 RepID=UPI0011CB9F6A|nr:penicillin-binding protein 2 [Ruania zhangjianzhongii]
MSNAFTRVGQPEKRQSVLLAALLVVVLAFAARLVYVQLVAGPALAAAAQAERSRTYVEHGPRGDIVDANGNVLATSAQTYRIAVDQRFVSEYKVRDDDGEVVGYGAAAAAEQLGPILDRDVNALGGQLVGDDGYVILARNVAPEVWREIAALNIPGISAEETFDRVYPNGNTAGQILGWVNAEGDGAAGLESSLNNRLLGTDGEFSVEIGAQGQVIPTGQRTGNAAMPGCTVQLTIDTDLQYFSQNVVDEAVETYGAEWGAAVVLDRDGNILALADSDAVDPNDPDTSGYTGAHSIQDVYDPGSTGKVLTVLTALEEGEITPTTPIEDPYQLTTDNGQVFHDHTEHPDQTLTTTGVLAHSANTGTVNIGSMVSDQTRYEYMQRLGWGEQSGIAMPGETRGLLEPPEEWDGRQRYTTMFGQGLSVNLLQNTGVFASIANGGVHHSPQLVAGYDCNGEQVEAERSEPVRVASQESSDQMIRMLESVVASDEGTGSHAAIDGYRVAGKTGTAQMPGPSGQLTEVAASFVGITPADDPAITVGVVMYNPNSGIYGGTIAAPVFQEISSFALQSLGVPPSGEPADPYPLTPDES